jgi:hypothetical protein
MICIKTGKGLTIDEITMINKFIDEYNNAFYVYYTHYLEINNYILYDLDEHNNIHAYFGCIYDNDIIIVNQFKIENNDIQIAQKILDTIKKIVKHKQLLIFVNICDYMIDYFKLLGFNISDYAYNTEDKIAMIQKI